MDTDNIGEESRSKDHEDRDSHIEHRWAILDRSCTMREPEKEALHGQKQEECPSYGSKKDIECHEARGSIDERNRQCKERPANDIVSDTSG